MEICSIDGCEKKASRRGWCNMHYKRWWRYGNVETTIHTRHGRCVDNKIPPEYNSWRHMKERCLNPKCKSYSSYGGRGILVCDRWLESFENFYEDMGSRPSPEHSIDRIDNNGNYTPENCRWTKKKEQNRNKRSNINLTYNDNTQCLNDWAEELGIRRTTLKERINRGWSVERALTEPVRK